MSIVNIIDFIKLFGDLPKYVNQYGYKSPTPLSCSVNIGISNDLNGEILPDSLPGELIELWNLSSEIRLFEDKTYGQWGLIIVSPDRSIDLTNFAQSNRQDQFKKTDLVIGEFLGDLDQIVISRDIDDFGAIHIALPLDTRNDWPLVGNSLSDFLTKFINTSGEKYWEGR